MWLFIKVENNETYIIHTVTSTVEHRTNVEFARDSLDLVLGGDFWVYFSELKWSHCAGTCVTYHISSHGARAIHPFMPGGAKCIVSWTGSQFPHTNACSVPYYCWLIVSWNEYQCYLNKTPKFSQLSSAKYQLFCPGYKAEICQFFARGYISIYIFHYYENENTMKNSITIYIYIYIYFMIILCMNRHNHHTFGWKCSITLLILYIRW